MGTRFLEASTFIKCSTIARFRAAGYWHTDPADPENYTWYSTDEEPLFEDILESYGNMRGREIGVSANNDWPFFAQQTLDNGTQVGTTGIDLTILKTLAKSLNFRFKVKPPPDKVWGGPLPNGTVTGLIGMAARWDAHMSIDYIGVTAARMTVADYTVPYLTVVNALFTLAPGLKSMATVIIRPFTLTVWLSLVAAIVVVAVIIVAINSRTVSAATTAAASAHTYSFADVAFNAFRSQLWQGDMMKLRFLPPGSRVMLFFFYLYCLNTIVYYSAVLTAMLSVPSFEQPLDSLEDGVRAVKQGYVLGMLHGTAVEQLFMNATVSPYKEVWETLDPVKSFRYATNKQAIEGVLKGDYGYVGSEFGSRLLCIQLGMNRFHIGKKTFWPVSVAAVLPKGAPYNHKFSQMLRRITEAGLVTKWTKDEIEKLGSRTKDKKDDAGGVALSLVHTQAAFLILPLGYGVSLLGLAAEKLLWWWRQAKGRDKVTRLSINRERH